MLDCENFDDLCSVIVCVGGECVVEVELGCGLFVCVFYLFDNVVVSGWELFGFGVVIWFVELVGVYSFGGVLYG